MIHQQPTSLFCAHEESTYTRMNLYSFRHRTLGQKYQDMYLLCHLSFELPIDDDLLFSRELAIEKFNRDILVIEMESPNVLLLRSIQNNSHVKYI